MTEALDWTPLPHWVVVTVDDPGVEGCAGHYPTRALAMMQAYNVRSRHGQVNVRPTSGHSEEEAAETERKWKELCQS